MIQIMTEGNRKKLKRSKLNKQMISTFIKKFLLKIMNFKIITMNKNKIKKKTKSKIKNKNFSDL